MLVIVLFSLLLSSMYINFQRTIQEPSGFEPFYERSGCEIFKASIHYSSECPVFKEYPSQKVSNSGFRLPQPMYSTLDQCKQACLVAADCQGIDYVATGTPNCYFIQTQLPQRVQDPTSTNYKLECRGATAGNTNFTYFTVT